MIIYGSKGTHLHSEQVNNLSCNHCGEISKHTFSIYGRYAHIYWIPLFPVGKKGFSECNHCKHTSERKEMSEKVGRTHDEILKKTKTPLDHFVGLFVIVGIIALGVFSSEKHKKDVVNYIEEPKTSDVIEYESSPSNYSTLKITRVTKDSVFFVANSMEISSQSNIYKIDKQKNYETEEYSMSREEYKNSFDDKKFLDVDR